MGPEVRVVSCGELTWGMRYWSGGPRRAVLLHGFPDNANTWTAVAEQLVAADFTVAAPFLPGYGPTGFAPDGRYDVVSLARHVDRLLDTMQWREVVLVGHDWGAAIASTVSALDSAAVSRLVTLSLPSTGELLQAGILSPRQLWQSRYIVAFQRPVAAASRFRNQPHLGIAGLWRQWSPTYEALPERIEDICASLSPSGRLEAALTYYRDTRRLLHSRDGEARRLLWAPATHPVVGLVGEVDRCVRTETFRRVRYPVHVVPGVGHFLPAEAPDVVARHVIDPSAI